MISISTYSIIVPPSVRWKAAFVLLSSLVLWAPNKAQAPPPTIAYTSPSYGAIGTQVMIKGKNFGFTQGTSKVTFHGTLSAPLVWNDDWILAHVPEGATPGLVHGKPDELTLERNGGYPSGFWYTVTVRRDGSVIWHGKESVRVKGTVQSRIPLASAAKLFDFAHEMNFFSAREIPYETCVTDGPEVNVTLREDGRERQISSYCQTTEGLGKLADQIDAAARTLRWIFIDGPTLNSLIAAGSFHIAKDGGPFMEGAIEWDRGDVVRILAKQGFNVNARNREQESYLMDAVLRNKPVAAKALLEAGADFAVRSSRLQETPAINAGYRGASMVKLFLDRHAPVNDADSNGNTMLMAAALQGHLDAVQLIVEAGADVNARNARGQTAIAVAEEYREKYYPGLSNQLNAVIDYLQQHGALR